MRKILIYNTRVAPQCSPHPPDTIYLTTLTLSSYFWFDSPDLPSSCYIFSPSSYTQIIHIKFLCQVHGASPLYPDCFLQTSLCPSVLKFSNFSTKSLKPESDSFLSYTFQFISFTTLLFLALQTELLQAP